MSQIVSRSMAPDAPHDSFYPNNPKSHHAPDCRINQETYTCSCGLLTHQLETGCFVLYDPYTMCRASHCHKKQDFDPITEVQDFLIELKNKCARLDLKK